MSLRNCIAKYNDPKNKCLWCFSGNWAFPKHIIVVRSSHPSFILLVPDLLILDNRHPIVNAMAQSCWGRNSAWFENLPKMSSYVAYKIFSNIVNCFPPIRIRLSFTELGQFFEHQKKQQSLQVLETYLKIILFRSSFRSLCLKNRVKVIMVFLNSGL